MNCVGACTYHFTTLNFPLYTYFVTVGTILLPLLSLLIHYINIWYWCEREYSERVWIALQLTVVHLFYFLVYTMYDEEIDLRYIFPILFYIFIILYLLAINVCMCVCVAVIIWLNGWYQLKRVHWHTMTATLRSLHHERIPLTLSLSFVRSLFSILFNSYFSVSSFCLIFLVSFFFLFALFRPTTELQNCRWVAFKMDRM